MVGTFFLILVIYIVPVNAFVSRHGLHKGPFLSIPVSKYQYQERKHEEKCGNKYLKTSNDMCMNMAMKFEDGEGNGKISENRRSESIEDLYRKAMDEDEEWYNSFLKNYVEDIDESLEQPSQKRPSQEFKDSTIVTAKNDKHKGSYDSIGAEALSGGDENDNGMNNQAGRRKRRQTGEEAKEQQKNVMMEFEKIREESSIEETMDEDRKDIRERDHLDFSEGSSPNSARSERKNDFNENSSNDVDDDLIMKFVNMFNIEQKIPLATVTKLGYKAPDVAKLRAEVLELIIEDEIQIPENGIPRRWLVPNKDSKEVKILQKRKKESRRGDGESRQKDKRPRYREDDVDRLNDRKEMRRRNPSSSSSTRRRRRVSRRERNMDETQDSKSSIWMDMPTFKQYLRREAELRLLILGPDWEDWVKGEGDWRLNLYQGWLSIVEDGYGDDVFDDISYAPPEMRSTNARRPKKKRIPDGEKRSRRMRPIDDNDSRRGQRSRESYKRYQGRDDDSDYDDDDYSRRPSENRFTTEKRRDNGYDSDDEIHRRKASTESFPNRREFDEELGTRDDDFDTFDESTRRRRPGRLETQREKTPRSRRRRQTIDDNM